MSLHSVLTLGPHASLPHLVESGLARLAGDGQVLVEALGLLAGDVVEVRGATQVEPVAEVLEEGATLLAEVGLELLDVLLTVLDLLAERLGEDLSTVVHGGGLGSGEVVEFVHVCRRVGKDDGSSLTNVVGRHKAVACGAQRGGEESVLVDVAGLGLDDVALEEVCAEHRALLNTNVVEHALLVTPVPLEHAGDLLTLEGGVGVGVVGRGEGVGTEAGETHDVLDVLREGLAEGVVALACRIRACGEHGVHVVEGACEGGRLVVVEADHLVGTKAAQPLILAGVTRHGTDEDIPVGGVGRWLKKGVKKKGGGRRVGSG